MKHFFICVAMLFYFSTVVLAGNDTVPMTYQPNASTQGGNGKGPVTLWYLYQEGNTLTMSSTPCDYTLSLYDEDGYEVYTTFVPAGTTMIVLPATLSGTFEIRFEADTYYYYGYITL